MIGMSIQDRVSIEGQEGETGVRANTPSWAAQADLPGCSGVAWSEEEVGSDQHLKGSMLSFM